MARSPSLFQVRASALHHPSDGVGNDGAYTDSTGDTGRASYKYRVCEAGTSTCSNTAEVPR